MLRLLRDNIQRYLSDHSGKDVKVLDCGSGAISKPYLPLFRGMSSLYVGLDLRGGAADVVGDVQKLPFKGSMFDAVLCIQVLEHVVSPAEAVGEIYRVLKPGGTLFLSTHGVWPVHDVSFDFWRWTDLGLKRILSSFSTVGLYECGGHVASLFLGNEPVHSEPNRLPPHSSLSISQQNRRVFRPKIQGQDISETHH